MFTILLCAFVYGSLIGLNFVAWWAGDCWVCGLRLVGIWFVGELCLWALVLRE